MRINGFEQIKALYSIVFESKYDFKPQHISLYVFLINQNNRNNWVEWFKCPYDLAMAGSCIGSKKTYYNCLNDLMEWGLLKYEKGSNEWKAPKIKLEVLKCTATNTATIPQSTPLPEPLDIPQGTHNIKPVTDNLKPETKEVKYYRIINHLKLSFEELDKLLIDYEQKDIDSVLDSIENYKKNKNYTSLYLTAKNWLGRDYKKKSEKPKIVICR